MCRGCGTWVSLWPVTDAEAFEIEARRRLQHRCRCSNLMPRAPVIARYFHSDLLQSLNANDD